MTKYIVNANDDDCSRLDHEAALSGLDLEEAVGYWDARLRNPDCSNDDRAAFKAWRDGDPERTAAFERAQALIANLDAAARRPEIQSMREAALAVDVRRDRKKLLMRAPVAGFMATAASLAMVIIAAAIWANGGVFDGAISRAPVVMNAPPFYATGVGERSTVALRDGSEATLNTDTRIRVDYSEGERLVTLLKGQALFDVAKNPDRPFVVAAGDRRITALGTVFDVKFLNDAVEVTLIEGLVEVGEEASGASRAGDRPGGQAARPDAPPVRQLKPGQQLIAQLDAPPREVIVRSTDAARAALWREGRVFFEDVSLAEAVDEMNRYNTLKIIVEGGATSAYRVNGTFRVNRQDVFVDALESYFPLRAEYEKDRIVIKTAQEG